MHAHDIHPTRRSAPGSFHGKGAPLPSPHAVTANPLPPTVVLPPPKRIPVLPPPGPAPPRAPLSALTAQQLLALDPTQTKSRLLSRTRDGLRPGDILQVRFSHRDPFSGVLLQLRRRGVDSSLLLRNQVTRIGVEMWVKLYSPSVAGVDVVQRARKRPRRARLYYLRKVDKDVGSVQNIVAAYVRQRAILRSGAAKKPGAGAGKRK
ncbi:putative mitochondrial ribosomal protein [Tirmania nivea]|nr:putative mitochondrial ribosomal protein [Tirmania nivea]